MKANLKFNNKNFTAEVSIANMIEEDENDLHDAYMNECMSNDAMFVNTAGMCTSDAKYMCGMSYMKNRPMLMEGAGELSDKQKTLPDPIKKGILKRYEKAGTLSEEGKKQLMSMSSSVEIEVNENENESDTESENEPKEMEEIQAEPTAVFVQKPAPSTGEITPKAAEEGLKIDEKLQKEQESTAPKNPQLQSATFNPKA